jgi:hypothetical protein
LKFHMRIVGDPCPLPVVNGTVSELATGLGLRIRCAQASLWQSKRWRTTPGLGRKLEVST